MSLKKVVSIFAMSAAVGMFGISVSAQEAPQPPGDSSHGAKRPYGMGHRGPKGGLLREYHGLDLTDAQKAQVHGILEANKPVEANHEEMRTLMDAKRGGTITSDQQARLNTLRDEQRIKEDQLRTQLDAVLTTEQKAKLDAKREERRKKMEERRGGRPPMPPSAERTDDN